MLISINILLCNLRYLLLSVSSSYLAKDIQFLHLQHTNTNIINKNDNLLKTINDIQKQGKTVALCKINGTNAGLIIFSDKIRDGVVEMIKNLKKDEIKETIMLTGDSVDNAKFIANQAAIDNYKYNLLPEDKVNEVKKLNEKFKNIVMVGDGINDAPALTTATTGIAMGMKGTAISAEGSRCCFASG